MRILVMPRSLTECGHPALERLRAAGFELVFSSVKKASESVVFGDASKIQNFKGKDPDQWKEFCGGKMRFHFAGVRRELGKCASVCWLCKRAKGTR